MNFWLQKEQQKETTKKSIETCETTLKIYMQLSLPQMQRTCYRPSHLREEVKS